MLFQWRRWGIVRSAVAFAALVVAADARDGWALSFTVNTNADDPDVQTDGLCRTASIPARCSLRAAIQEANAAGGGPHIITLDAGNIILKDDIQVTSEVTVSGTAVAANTVRGHTEQNRPKTRLFVVSGGGKLTLTKMTLREGVASAEAADAPCGQRGGAVCNLGTDSGLTITDCLLQANEAVTGGAVYGGAMITNSRILENKAVAGGGGLAVGSTKLTLVNTDVTGNTTTSDGGGGIFVFEGATLEVSQSSITGNRVVEDGRGGGIALEDSGPGTRLLNTTISGNSVTDGPGGGIDVSALSPGDAIALNNVTIVANKSSRDGGGVDVRGQRLPSVRNTIFADNLTGVTTGQDGQPLQCRGDFAASSANNLIETSDSQSAQGCARSSLDDFTNVRITAELSDDGGKQLTKVHRLPTDSQALNRGVACESNDQWGRPRPADTASGKDRCDAGAFELLPDCDSDGVTDKDDTCVAVPNPEQSDPKVDDPDGDRIGRVCDACPTVDNGDGENDQDGDGVRNREDCCPKTPGGEPVTKAGCSALQACDCRIKRPEDPTVMGDFDLHWNGRKEWVACITNAIADFGLSPADRKAMRKALLADRRCGRPAPGDGDTDGDGVPDRGANSDNCPRRPNPQQNDLDDDGKGDACDADDDGDGLKDWDDLCPTMADPENKDTDNDLVGDVCDCCPWERDGDFVDAKGCNPGQVPMDPTRDACDPPVREDADRDQDGIPDVDDNCLKVANSDQLDTDKDGKGDLCDKNKDGDKFKDENDLCPLDAEPKQNDADGDGLGDKCDCCPNAAGPIRGCPEGQEPPDPSAPACTTSTPIVTECTE